MELIYYIAGLIQFFTGVAMGGLIILFILQAIIWICQGVDYLVQKFRK